MEDTNTTQTRDNEMKDESRMELFEGLNGSGHKVWLVFTMRGNACKHIERFDTEAEARHWMKWT